MRIPALAVSPEMTWDELRLSLSAYICNLDAEIGIGVLSDRGDTLTLNNDRRYPLMSVYKFHQALAVAHWLSQQHRLPQDTARIPDGELRSDTYSPLRDLHPQGDVTLSFKEIFSYTLQLSDNNVCDYLFRHFVSPAETLQFLKKRKHGQHCDIRYTEQDMAGDYRKCYANWTTPYAAALLLRDFLQGKIVKEPYLSLIRENMLQCRTGAGKLSVPIKGTTARIGHKTGGGPRTPDGRTVANNDIGFVILPDGRTYLLTVFVKDARLSPTDSDRVIADISKMVYQYFVR